MGDGGGGGRGGVRVAEIGENLSRQISRTRINAITLSTPVYTA